MVVGSALGGERRGNLQGARRGDSKPMVELPKEGRRRVVITRLTPEIDSGRFGIKRVIGERVIVEADVFADGHDQVTCQIVYWQEGSQPQVSTMKPLGHDRWRGEFSVVKLGTYLYTVEGWIDRFQTWQKDLEKRIAANQDISVDLLIGAQLIESSAARAKGEDAKALHAWAQKLREGKQVKSRNGLALDADLLRLVQLYPERDLATRYDRVSTVVVDREKAGFSAWYEVFPRSCSSEDKRHGTFRDCERWLPYIASMGFDIIYLPPIHPIGTTFRKGKNNSLPAEAGDVGSPWAIGSAEGGHKSIHPQLGTLEDFRGFRTKAAECGLEVALDIALQCSADHPYVREHPEWFSTRPDGSIQYAENPPKKYQDIYPLDFANSHWPALWEELKSIFLFWVEQGVRIFRVDNPHTKAFPFWEWVISEIKKQHPDVLFLAEAFTRPNVMYWLAKLGFSQSYTYFTWRNTKPELTEYLTELTQTEVREYLRPNLWPNTPDILPEYLQVGGRAAFMVRFILAATLGASYGIYGPAFESCENVPLKAGSEEYLDSEKYQLKHRDLNSTDSLKQFISRVNRIRKENPALQSNGNLRFHQTDNPSLICYSKATDDLSNVIIVVVNLDCIHVQAGWLDLDLRSIGLDSRHTFQANDLLSGGRFLWQGPRNYVELTPESLPAHVLCLRRWVRTEQDFDYYL
jgi:starch synthase (maltosyl-transferring)